MSARELSRFTTANDSNIPRLKKTLAGAKKSRGCSKLPGLQKYIETIIKASNDIDSENMPLSDKEKLPKGRRFGKHVVCMGLDNKINHERLKFDVISNRRKNKRQSSKKYSEAVSRGVAVLHKFFSEFEDPRNWKIQNSGTHLKIEKLIEKFYPNPYMLSRDNNCQTSETQINIEKVNKDELGDETSYDVFISKVDAETQDDLENTNFDLLSADFQKMLSERENKSKKADLAPIVENLPHDKIKNLELKHSRPLELNAIPNTTNKSLYVSPSNSNSVSKVSSRVSSIESVNKLIPKETQINCVNKKKNKASTKVNSKEILPKAKKSKTLTVVDENDYDLGKLKLLNLSDSDSSISKKFHSEKKETKNKNYIATDDFVNEISSEICNEISKTNDLNDLLQIYEVMNKATESFLYLTSMKKPGSENAKVLTDLPEDLESSSQSQKDAESPKEENLDSSENKNADTESTNKPDSSAENENLKEEEKTTVENDSQKNQDSINEKNVDSDIKSEMENEKVDSCDEVEIIVVEGEKLRKVEDEIFDANQKINEVLQFMNDCLLRFNTDEKLLNQEKRKYEDEATSLSKIVSKDSLVEEELQKTPSDSDLTESSSQTEFLNFEEEQSNPPEILEMTNNHNARIQCKRKSKIHISNQSVAEKKNTIPPQQSVSRDEASTSNFDRQYNAESAVINNENIVQVVEIQNELGGYAEESQEENIIPNNDTQILKKPVLPISTKARRSLPETYKTLKDALETEEKLLKLNKPDPQNIITGDPETQNLIQDTVSGYTPVRGFVENINSSFVLCISPFNQNLQPATAAPSLALPKPLSLSLIDFRSWSLKPLPQEYLSEKVFIPSQTEYKAAKFMYSFKEDALRVLHNSWVTYYAKPICFTALLSYPEIQNEYSLEYSKQQIKVKPLKKFSIVNLNTPGTSEFCIRNTLTFTTNKSNFLKSSDSRTNIKTFDKPVEALIKAIQETENVFLLQQHNNSGNKTLGQFESICECQSHEELKKEPSDNNLEQQNDKEKVQDLLLRTYKLQKKLQQYLDKISQPARLSRSLITDLGVITGESDMLEPEIKMSHINIQTETSPPTEVPFAEKDPKTNEAITVNVEMIDRSTTYFPPGEDAQKMYENQNLSCVEKKEETPANLENDEDDRSSTYSFKSSNDFSETNEAQQLLYETSGSVTKGDVIKRIFSQIELLKQSVDAEDTEKPEKNKIKEKGVKDNKLVEFDPKTPAKVLKTVFKGRKSSTELTIGLKDVPMTKVSNISVEKTKFSPNHTKISIYISKENQNQINTENSDSKFLSNKDTSCYFDHVRPLSMCPTEYSKGEDVSKSSQSLNQRSDDDEDDYKSVGSTAGDSKSGSSSNPEISKTKNHAVVKMSQTKNYTKHKFDFYRKMDMNVEGVKVRQKPPANSLCRFRELEPLKQALTELQIRMRSIKRDAVLNSDDYYERALKLAKMSAGYCQSCGTRAVIPDDTFGYYRSLLPRRHPQQRRNKSLKTTITPNSSFYSFRSSNAELSGQFCDLDIQGGSSFSLNRTTHSNRTVLRSSLQDMPIVFEKI